MPTAGRWASRQWLNNSGTFSSDYGNCHIQQIGITVTGCYEFAKGLIDNGVFEGSVLRFTWSSGETAPRDYGPAIILFGEDGKSFVGHFWHAGQSNPRDWKGTRISKDVGSCPNWKPGTGNQATRLSSSSRVKGVPACMAFCLTPIRTKLPQLDLASN
jgi:hypothetical protein